MVEEKKNWRRVVSVPVVALMVFGTLLIAANPAVATTKNVTVTITQVWQIDRVDTNNEADFFWYVTFDGVRRECSPHPWTTNDNRIEPGWSTIFSNKQTGQTYDFSIELWDCDCGSSGEDICDISKVDSYGGRASIATMVYNIDTNTWSGDSTDGYVDGEEYPDSSTDSDEDDCSLWFTVTTS